MPTKETVILHKAIFLGSLPEINFTETTVFENPTQRIVHYNNVVVRCSWDRQSINSR